MLLSTFIGFGQNGSNNSVVIELTEDSQEYEALIVQKFNSVRNGTSYQTIDSLMFQFEVKKLEVGNELNLWQYSSRNHEHFFGNTELMRLDTTNRSNKILPVVNYFCSHQGEYKKLEDWENVISKLNLIRDYFPKEENFQKSILYELNLIHFLRGMRLSFHEVIKKKSYLLMDSETGGGRFHMPTDVSISIEEVNEDSTQIKVKVTHQIDYQSLYGFPVEFMIQGALKNNPELTSEELESKLMKEIGVEFFDIDLSKKELLNVESEYLLDDERGTSNYHRFEIRRKK